MWKVTADPTRFEEAIAWFRGKVPITKPEWEQLTDVARRRAFTIAGVADLDLMAEVQESMMRALEQGVFYRDWAASVKDQLYAAWGGPDAVRLETIFHANIQSAYQAGRYRQITDPDVLAARPFWLFDAILDDRTTSICQGLNGTIRPADDPYWSSRIPPLHFRCRSGLRTLTASEGTRRGVTQRPSPVAGIGGFGRPPTEHWGRGWAERTIQDAAGPTWREAFLGEPPTFRAYGRPGRIPTVPLPVPPLPTIKEAGADGFRRALQASWGGPTIDVLDPTRTGVIVDERLLGYLKHDGRERWLSLLPDLLADPFEVWLMPMRDTRGGRVVFRRRYIKAYQDARQRNLVLSADLQKGTWVGWTTFETDDLTYIDRQRRGFLRWPRG
jgi:SPP1 gp7 family putative phage head morphogenesis protein